MPFRPCTVRSGAYNEPSFSELEESDPTVLDLDLVDTVRPPGSPWPSNSLCNVGVAARTRLRLYERFWTGG